MKKKLISSIFLAGICMFLSCKKETYKTRYEELLPKNNGMMSGLLNGKEWNSDIYIASYFKSDESSNTIDFTARIFRNGNEIQQLSIGMIDLLSSVQEIQQMVQYDSVSDKYSLLELKSCYSTFFPIDVDVPENIYVVSGNGKADSRVRIHEYNPTNKSVKGSFEAHYVRITKESPLTQGLPDTLHFTNGKFEFQLK